MSSSTRVVVLVLLIGIVIGVFQLGVLELVETGAAFRAKTLCSGAYVSGRPLADIDRQEFRGSGDFLSSLMVDLLSVEESTASNSPVVAIKGLFGLVYRAAIYRGPSLGCSLLPRQWRLGMPVTGPLAADYRLRKADDWVEQRRTCKVDEDSWWWPEKRNWTVVAALAAEAREVNGSTPKRVRGLVVVHKGRIVGEVYSQHTGFLQSTPQHGWSMTKSLMAALVGIRLAQAPTRLPGLHEPVNDFVPEWRGRNDVPPVTLAQLLRMESALDFADEYSPQGRVVEMLFRTENTAAFSARQPFVKDKLPGEVFAYSSGVSNIISRLLRDSFDHEADYLRFPTEALFHPLQMDSACIEVDTAGVFVGSSFSYATPRDYAKFGLLLLQRGRWQVQRDDEHQDEEQEAAEEAEPAVPTWKTIIPEDFVEFMMTPTNASAGQYGGQIWLNTDSALEPTPPKLGKVIAALGHDCQMIAVLPDHDLVVVRMGLTKKSSDQCQTNPFLTKLVDIISVPLKQN